MSTEGRIRRAKDGLARDGIEVTVQADGDALCVHVVASKQTEPATWVAVWAAFFPINSFVKIS